MVQLDTTTPVTPRHRRRRGFLTLLLVGSVITTFGAGAASLALFTDAAGSDATFTTGSIDITASPSVVFNVSGMMPGDVESATLTVANAGTEQFRYAMTASATNADGFDLGGWLVLDLQEGACPSTGTSLYSGALGSASFGSAASGGQGGDRVLDGSTSEELCFKVSLPTSYTHQGATTTATFTFTAEQTANN